MQGNVNDSPATTPSIVWIPVYGQLPEAKVYLENFALNSAAEPSVFGNVKYLILINAGMAFEVFTERNKNGDE